MWEDQRIVPVVVVVPQKQDLKRGDTGYLFPPFFTCWWETFHILPVCPRPTRRSLKSSYPSNVYSSPLARRSKKSNPLHASPSYFANPFPYWIFFVTNGHHLTWMETIHDQFAVSKQEQLKWSYPYPENVNWERRLVDFVNHIWRDNSWEANWPS